MPVLAREDELDITPRSLVRHRPINERPSSGKRKTASMSTSKQSPSTTSQRASRLLSAPITESGTGRKQGEKIAEKPQIGKTRVLGDKLAPPQKRRFFALFDGRASGAPLLYLGLGMLVMLVLWVGLNAVFGWWNTFMDDWRYGRPRTYQVDARVGHNEQTGRPSHFIAINLNKHIQIIELQGGDPAKARIYTGPQLYGENDDLVPVTLRFEDVNGDKKPDMIVLFQQTHIIFMNDGTGFRQMLPSEQRQIDAGR